MKRLASLAIVLLLAVLALGGCYLLGLRKGVKKADEWIAAHTNTTTQIDTNKTEAPLPDTVYLVKNVPYPVYVPGETPEPEVVVKDSIVYLMLPRTVKEYRKPDYYARISGIDPELDYIETYAKTEKEVVYVPQETKQKRDFLELDLKFIYDGMPMAPATLNIGYRRGPFEVYAGGGYDLLQKNPVGLAGIRARVGW